jgi:hypothetical protein
MTTEKCLECLEKVDDPRDHSSTCKIGFEARLRKVCDPGKHYLIGAHTRISHYDASPPTALNTWEIWQEIACSPLVVFVGRGRFNTREGSGLLAKFGTWQGRAAFECGWNNIKMATYIPLVRECKKPEMHDELQAYYAIGVLMRVEYAPAYLTSIEKTDNAAAMERLQKKDQ